MTRKIKNLIYLIPLFLTSYTFGDSLTTGNMQLLIPSTGIVDKSRSWADKINTNFKIIDSTTTTMQTQINNLNTATGTANTNFYAYTSTNDAQQTKFQNFSTTADVKNDNFNAFQSTSDSQQTKFINFGSTTDTQITTFQNFRATGDVQIANLVASTYSINTPFGIAPVLPPSTATVLGTTNPYRTISIPAAAWFGMGVASASWTNSGFPISSGTVQGLPFNRIGRTFHEFRTPLVSTSIALVEFRMPFEWDGSSVGVQIEWYAASGTANTNTMWSFDGIAITSGTSAFPVFTSSTSVQSTYITANQEALSPLSAGLSIEGSPVPGSKVVFFIMAGGGGFDGLPHATELLVSYRQAVWDGKSR